LGVSAHRLLICGFGSFPAAPRNPSGLVVERLATDGFRPAGLDASYLTLPVAWARAAELAVEHLAHRPADGVLLVGVAVEADDFRVETMARNRAAEGRLDHDGRPWLRPDVVTGGAETHRATAPVDVMLAALARAGLRARPSEDAGSYLCNFVFYRLLNEGIAPAVGFLHVPQSRDLDPVATMPLATIAHALRVAATAFAEALKSSGASTRTG
jgi:pyroglutamyl-peptidase